jgi:gluconate 2-dehydrogenase gamma chain
MTAKDSPTDHVVLSRRGLLRAGLTTGVAAASSAIPLVAVYGTHPDSVSADSHTSHQAQQPAPTLGGFTYFNTFQAEIVNAAAGRLIPTDATGPGAIEAGVVFFIDRQLSALYGLTGRRYENGPYATGTSTQGDQSGLDMRDRYRLGIQGMQDYSQQLYQSGFARLTAAQQDRVLTDMQAGVPDSFDGNSIQAATTMPASGGGEALEQMAPGAPGVGAQAFFNLLLSHTIAGFFADPVYGGNQDMIGWKLIGFPGAQMSYANDILSFGVPFIGASKSLAEYQGQFDTGG